MGAQDLRSYEFKVTIGRTLEGIEYPVQANSHAGSAAGVFVLPFSVDQIEQTLQNFCQGIPVGRYRRTRRTRKVQFDELSPEGFGSALFQALFSDKVLALYRNSLSMVGRPGMANRMPVKLNIVWQLAHLPWELLYDTEKSEFLGFGQDTPVVRVFDREPRPPTFDPPLRILLVSTHSADTELLEPERKVVGEALDTLIREDKVRIDYFFEATTHALRSRVRECEPHVIHFMGHGQVNHLLLEDRSREGASLTESNLGIILRNAFSLRMVVFNACETARPPGDSGRRLELAHGLARREVPATITMQFGISDDAAQEFVRELYQVLAEGQPIDEAVLRGRIAIQNRFTDSIEWAAPVLYMQAGDGQIFNDLLPMEEKELTYPEPEKRPKEPTAEKESLEPVSKDWVRSYYEQGLRHLDEGKWDLALPFFEDVQRVSPTYKDVQGLVGKAREELAKQETERRTQEKLAALYRQAIIHCEEDRWQAAVDLFNEILDIDPDYKDVKVQAETARRAHAQQLVAGQLRSHLATLYQQAQEHLAAEEWERAVELLEQVVSMDRDYADALTQLVKAQRGKSLAELYQKAEEAFYAQNWEQAIANLGAAFAIDRSYKDVETKLEQARQQQRWDALYQEGLEYLESERWDAAVETLRQVQPDQKRRKDVEIARLYAEGRQYMAQENWETALARLEEVVGENRQYRDAARQLQEARRQKRLHELYTAGLEQAKAQEWRQAVLAFEEIAREAPNYRDVQSQLALFRGEAELAERYASGKRFFDLGQWSEAIQDFQSIIKVRPDYPNAQRMLEEAIQEQKLADLYAEGTLYLAQGQWQEAIDAFERLVDMAPDYRDAARWLDDARKKKVLSNAYERGKTFYEQGHWAEAIRYLKQVMAYEEEYRDVAVLLAEAKEQEQLAHFYQQGMESLSMKNWDKAISFLELVVKLDQNYGDAGTQLAEAQLQKRLAVIYAETEKLMEAERWKDAATAFQYILEIAPDYQQASKLLAEAQRQHRLAMLYTAASQDCEKELWAEAVRQFQQIMTEDAGYRDVKERLAEAHRQQELKEQHEQGMVYFERGDWDRAISALGAVVEKDLNYKDAFVKLIEARRRQSLASHYVQGEQYMADEHWDEAIATFEKIMGIDPHYRDVKKRLDEANQQKRLAELYARGLRFYEVKKWSKALEVWNELTALEPNYLDVTVKIKEAEQKETLEEAYAIGVASLTGDWEQAISAFEKIIGINADYRDVRDRLREAEQGRWAGWKSRMLSSLQASGKLTANSLNYVPKPLRSDTMRRFYEEYSENLELVPSADFQVLTLRNFDLVSDLRETWRALLKAIQSEQADIAKGEPKFWARLKRGELFGSEDAKPFDILADELADRLCNALGFVRTPDQDRQHKQLYVRMISTPTLYYYKLPLRSPLIIFAKQFVEAEDIRDLLDLMYILEHTAGLAFLVTLDETGQLKTLLDQGGIKRDFVVLNRHDLEQILLSHDKVDQLAQTILGQVSLTVISPYLDAGPVPEKMFFGREKEIKTIRDNIRDTNVALTGGRRIGKTSILRKLQRILTTQLDCKTFHLDCQAIDTYEIFNREFTRKLSDQFEPPQTFRQAIETMRAAEDKLIVVLLDEVDDLLQRDVEQRGERLFKELRSLSQEGYCNFIFCGGKTLYERIHNQDSPFFNFCRNVVLRFLNEESATEIIIHPMSGMGIELMDRDELVAQILEVSSCHPNIVQLICKEMIENIKGRTISLDDLHEVIKREDFYTKFKEIAWGQSTPLEKIVSLAFVEEEDFTPGEVYQRLAKFGIEDIEAIDDALDTLELYSLITRRGKKYEYALREFPHIVRETEDAKTLIDSFVRQHGKEAGYVQSYRPS